MRRPVRVRQHRRRTREGVTDVSQHMRELRELRRTVDPKRDEEEKEKEEKEAEGKKPEEEEEQGDD
ncbi:MAG: hypothetical protein V1492_04015 [Candidatus Micrarchaeota archaeon]